MYESRSDSRLKVSNILSFFVATKRHKGTNDECDNAQKLIPYFVFLWLFVAKGDLEMKQ